MTTPKENALRQQGESNTKSIIYYIGILADVSKLVKKKYKRISRSFWVASYNLETARKEHADLGHLWKQVWYCIVLSVFRLISGVVR